MPITIQATEGVLSPAAGQQLFADLTDTFLRLHGLAGNAFLPPNVIGEINEIPAGRSFAGGQPANIVVVELKVPSFVLAAPEQKEAFIREATELVHQASEGKQPRERIWVNMVYTVDGLWGIAGQAYTNAQLGAAVAS